MVNISQLHQVRVEENRVGKGSDTISLEADTGESLLVWGIGVSANQAGAVAELAIDETTMLNFPAALSGNSLLSGGALSRDQTSIRRKLRQMGAPQPPYPIAEGQTISITADAGDIGAGLLYVEGSAGDYRATDPNGTESGSRSAISIGRRTGQIGANSTVVDEIETSRNIGGIDPFPFGADLGPNTEFDVHMIAVDLAPGAGSNVDLTGVRLRTEEQEFLARESDFVEGISFDFPDTDFDVIPYHMQGSDGEYPTFSPGDNLDIEVRLENVGSSAEDAPVDAAVIGRRREV